MPKPIFVINGPNLNRLGKREPDIYGTTTLAEIDERLCALARELGDVELECFQSNHEGAIVDLIQQRHGTGLGGCILNPAGFTTTSVSIHDAIKAVDYPFVEVHLSNQYAREDWRKRSIVASAAMGSIQGFGWRGYEAALRVLRPGGTLSSLGVYSGDLTIPLGAFAAGLGDHRIITTLCPGGKERMRRLISVIEAGRVDLGAMVTHRFRLEDIEAAYELFGHQRDGVLKVAIEP